MFSFSPDARNPGLMFSKGFALCLADFTRGLPPFIVDWFLHSKDPLAVENRERIRARYAQEMYNAIKRQEHHYQRMKAEAPFIDKKSGIRPIGRIDPVIAQDYRNRYGSECLNNQDFLSHCRRTAPELFYPE